MIMRKGLLLFICLLTLISCKSKNRCTSSFLYHEYIKAREYAFEVIPDSLMRIIPQNDEELSTVSSFGSNIYDTSISKSYYSVREYEPFPWEYYEEHLYDNESEYFSIKDSVKYKAVISMTPEDVHYDLYRASIYLEHPDYPDNPIFLHNFQTNSIESDSTTTCHLPKDAEIYIDKIGYHQVVFNEEAESKPYLIPEVGHGYISGSAFMDRYLWATYWVMVW